MKDYQAEVCRYQSMPKAEVIRDFTQAGRQRDDGGY